MYISIYIYIYTHTYIFPVSECVYIYIYIYPLLQRSFQSRDLTLVSALQTDCLPAEPQRKPQNTGVGSHSLLQQILQTQESNRGLLRCRWILYRLSYPGSPFCLSLSLSLSIYIYIYIYLYININIYLYIYIFYIFIYLYIHTYIYIYKTYIKYINVIFSCNLPL